ncbi:MAG: SDR family NAD(P)-dependent oxidoreductase [Desulfocapsaceae bacterium]|nr:SDR family NAD(P)-dependent oxidoreductase [Desulfocapsaceae bacterium]
MDSSFFSGKIILLTGATGDLGSTLARSLSSLGADLVLSSRSAEKLETLIDTLPQKRKAIALPADLSQQSEAEKLADRAIEQAGHIDILINNAGLGYFALMEEADEEKIRYLFEVNTFSPLALINRLTPHMAKRGGGRIINIVSSAGRVPIPTVGVYGGSKSALAVMTNTMRLELEPKNIDVLNIYPGTINDSFERNAMRENDRLGLCPTADCGDAEEMTVAEIIAAAAGEPGEIWLEKTGKWMALAAIAWPSIVDNRLKHLRNKAVTASDAEKPKELRRWRLLQVESSLACNLKCIMCPWVDERKNMQQRGHMSQATWEAILPHLPEVRSIDFTGGGEPLLQKNLLEWIGQAKASGCEAGFLTNGLLLSEEVSRRVLDAGINWIGFSVDGADKETYDFIRRGSDFDVICKNIKYLTDNRVDTLPMTMINFVIMQSNYHQLEKIIQLAHDLGVDQVNFKQCDVIRGEHGKEFGLFDSEETKKVKQLKKALDKANRLARKLEVKTTSFSFVPEEQSVCDQDPRDSLFIRFDGSVSPCINLAIGGPSTFLGKDIIFPHVAYGKIPDEDILALWESEQCNFYRRTFSQRVKAYDAALAKADFGHDIIKLKEAFRDAIKAMPEAPDGCKTCHYLYDI